MCMSDGMCKCRGNSEYNKTADGYVLVRGCAAGKDSTLFDTFDRLGDGNSVVVRAGKGLYSVSRKGNSFFVRLISSDAVSFLAEEMDKALRTDGFVLHFQPQVSLGTGCVTGAETLVRLYRPGIGLIPPSCFIPVAESTGQIREIGFWIIERVCAEFAPKMCGENGLRVSVNVSVRQLEDERFAPFLESVLHDFGVHSPNFVAEITETVVPSSVERLSQILGRVRKTGIKIAVDDFGAGQSSFAYLRNLPVDFIKLDKTFADSLHTKAGYVIAESVVGMAKSLGCVTIAEGVETEKQAVLLRRMRCEEAQGYLFCPALPEAKFAEYMRWA